MKEFPILPKIHIKKLEIENCGFSDVHGKVFNSIAEHLEELRLVNVSLKEIPVLEAMPKLETLNLNGNQVERWSRHKILDFQHTRTCFRRPKAAKTPPTT